jgi:hypothetical protein
MLDLIMAFHAVKRTSSRFCLNATSYLGPPSKIIIYCAVTPGAYNAAIPC